MTNDEKFVIEAVIKSYISVMGEKKWNSLTGQQQHDVIMTIIRDALNIMN